VFPFPFLSHYGCVCGLSVAVAVGVGGGGLSHGLGVLLLLHGVEASAQPLSQGGALVHDERLVLAVLLDVLLRDRLVLTALAAAALETQHWCHRDGST
jgi:hypothetical protein